MKYQLILQKMKERGLKLGSVESFTGGLFASTVVNYPGVSSTYKGSIIAYDDEVKHQTLKIPEADIKKYGVVSSVVALEMARRGQKLLKVDFCIAFTGNAGPTSVDDEHDVGEFFIALAYREDEILYHFKVKGDRQKVRAEAVDRGFEMIDRVLENYK